MSFQNFRLDAVPIQHFSDPQQQTPLPFGPPAGQTIEFPVPLGGPPGPELQIQIQHANGQPGSSRGPYGSGDMNDGYTMLFPTMEAFEQWRFKEEEEKMVEFVKGDTHGSKAVPPRFKDHVKLVCARHSRSGRKKYVKKFPERVRKVPSRKLDGKGCSASISYKTYFDSDEVRVCYVSQHSHEIGLANLPYTRRGRREAVGRPFEAPETASISGGEPSQDQSVAIPAGPDAASTVTGPHPIIPAPASPPMRAQAPQHPTPFTTSPYPHFPSMSMPVPISFGGPPQVSPGTERERLERERWDRMETLFQGIRHNARQFEYPAPSVAALESVLMRMYFESPVHHPQMGMMQPVPMIQQPPSTAMVLQGQGTMDTSMNVNGEGEEESQSTSASGADGEGS